MFLFLFFTFPDSSNTIIQAFTEDKWDIVFNNEKIIDLCSIIKQDLNISGKPNLIILLLGSSI